MTDRSLDEEAPADGRAYALVEPILADIDRRLVREDPVLEIFRYVAEELAERLELPLVWIGLKAPDGSVESQVAAGAEVGYLEGVEVRWDETPEGRGPSGEAMRTGDPVRADIRTDPAFRPWRERAVGHGLAASLAVPVRTNDFTVGALNLYAREPDAFSGDERRLFGRVADQLSVAVLRARDVERLRVHDRALEALGEGVAILDLEGRIAWLNDAFARLVGRSPDDLEGASLSDVAAGASGPGELAGAVAGERRWTGRIPVRGPDGEDRILRTTVTPVRQTGGGATHRVVIAQDVTDREREREELARHNRALRKMTEDDRLWSGPLEEAFRCLTEHAADAMDVTRVGVWLSRGDGTLEGVDVLDRRAGEHRAGARLSPDDCPAYFEALAEERQIVVGDIRADPRTRDLWEPYARDRGVRALLDAPIHLRGELAGVVCHESRAGPREWSPLEQLFAASVADTASLALEASERRRLETRYRQLFESVNEAIFVTTREGEHLEVNPAFEAVTGYDEEELRELNARDLYAEPGAREAFLEEVDRRGSVREHEVGIRRKDGQVRQCLLNATVRRDERGRIEGYQGTLQDVTEARRRQRELAESKEHLESLLSTAPAVIFRLELPPIRPTYVSPNFEEQTGHPTDRLTEEEAFWRGRVPEEDLGRIERAIHEGSDRADGRVEAEFRFQHADGELHWYHAVARLERDGEGAPRGVVGSALDVTGRRRAREELRRSERRYRTLFERAQEAISITTPDGRFVDVNPAWLRLLGYERDDLQELRMPECCMESDEYRRFRAALEGEGYVHRMEMRLRHRDGHLLHCLVSSTAHDHAGDDGSEVRHVTFLQDISDRKEFEAELRYQALHDPLTGLPNRALFRDRLDQALARAERRQTGVLLAFVDLDRFKAINDSFGHSTGDRMLRRVGEHLAGMVRSQDTAARIGGDEFVLLVEDLDGPAGARTAGDRIVEGIRGCTESMGAPYHVTASIGIVVHDGGREPVDGETFLKRADLAMYEAKGRTGTTCHVFDPEADSAGLGRLEREQEIRGALQARAFAPAYQPVVELETGDLWGVELLARWDHPERGRVPPEKFIPVAEETGLILELGRQLLEVGTDHLAGWRGIPASPRLLFNLSASQFEDPDLPDLIRGHLERHGLPPSSLQLEVTETELMQSPERIQPVRDLGVGLVVDDFGTGYSSLSYLRDLDVDGLKIDMSFVHGMAEHEEDRAIVETILTLGRRLGLTVIAEGIETGRQASLLRQLGCELGQGFRFARPAPPEAIEGILPGGIGLEPGDG